MTVEENKALIRFFIEEVVNAHDLEPEKEVESWAMQDRLGLLTQLGLVASEADSINWAGSISAAQD